MESEYPKKADRPQLYRFKLDVALGQGGTGTVYRAFDPETKRVVAVKLFRANFFRNKMHIRDLAKSASRFKKIDHPNLVKVYEFVRGDEGECLVIEYVDGPDLKWYLANRAFNLQERLVILAQMCNGLGAIHENGLLHHDLKPANVLFTRKGQVKLCDYSLCGSGYLLSLFDSAMHEQVTPMYISPEILRKEKGSHLSDLYSLGILMYLMFTERFPFEVDSLAQLYQCHLNATPVHPTQVKADCPQPLGDIIMNLMDKKPKKRFRDTDELRIALSDIGRSRI